MPIKRKYLDILRIEVEDLIEDIGLIVNEYTERRDRGEITNYVFLENLAVLHNELLGVDDMMEMLDSVDPESYSNLDELVADIEVKIKNKIKNSHLAEALYPLVKRKLEKVSRYVAQVP
jgi:hypothetical protein